MLLKQAQELKSEEKKGFNFGIQDTIQKLFTFSS
jgi:hypothetical protein